jgi:hypothetical protein
MHFAPAPNVTEARRRTKFKLDSLTNQNRNLREIYTGAMVEISNLNPRRFLILLLVMIAPDNRAGCAAVSFAPLMLRTAAKS